MPEWIDPIDELGQLREEMRALQAREKQLRMQLLRDGYQTRSGARFRVRVEEKPHRRFNKEALPPHIRNDPSYLAHEMRTYVRTFPIDDAPQARSVEPKRRSAPLDDFDDEVIEDRPVQNRKYR